MIFCADVFYLNDSAFAAGGVFSNWNSTEFINVYTETVDNIMPYEPGNFYKRELPVLMKLIDRVVEQINVILVDGFVTLGSEERPGLGAHLYEELCKTIPVIGVAKNWFKNTPDNCRLFRGKSNSPLYITSRGMPLEEAKALIASMAGEYRLPTLLKEIDRRSRFHS